MICIDNDLHIHSYLSKCSGDPAQDPECILRYAKENNLKTVCLTDHFWDESVEGASRWYEPQNYAHIAKALPLPQAEGVRFLFGCEADMDKYLTVGISPERYDLFDFIIISTTHLHMKKLTSFPEEIASAEARAKLWIKRLEGLLAKELPFHKIGIAHLTCSLIAPTREEYMEVLRLLPETDLRRLFQKAAKLGAGIELNASDMSFRAEEQGTVLRIYRIAKECGCKFYFGSDAHQPAAFEKVKSIFEKAAMLLELTEEDKFLI